MLPNDPAAPVVVIVGHRGRRSGRARDGAPATSYVQPPVAIQAPPTARARGRLRRGPSILAIAVGRRRPPRWGRAVHVRRPRRRAPRRAARARRRAGPTSSSRSGTPTRRSRTATPAATSTSRRSIRGAIRGMVESLGDPYSAYLTPEEYQSGLQDLSGQFEGIGAEIGTRSTRRADEPTARRSAPTASSSSSRRSMARRPRRPGLVAGDAILAIDGAGLDGLTVDAAREQGPRQEGHDGRPDDRARQRRPVRRADRPRRHRPARGHRRRTSRTARSATSTSPASRTTPRAQFHDALQADLDAGQKKIVLDLRGNPGGYVDGGPADRVASSSAPGRSSGRRTPRASQVETDASSGGLATADDDPARRPRRQGQRLGERDRGRRPPGPQPGDARRRDDVRQGHGPAVDRAPGNGALKLTIAKWLTPDKRWIHHVGLVAGRRGRDPGRSRTRTRTRSSTRRSRR